jgi:hypothetical protein
MCSHLSQWDRLHECLWLQGGLMCLFCLQGEWANFPWGACPPILGQDNLVYAHCLLISASGTCLPNRLKTWHNIPAPVLPCWEAISLQRGFVLFYFILCCSMFYFLGSISWSRWIGYTPEEDIANFGILFSFFSNFSISWSRWICYPHEEDLAKFGYQSERRVGKTLKLRIVLATCKNLLCSKYDNLTFLTSGEFWGNSPPPPK